MRDALQVGQEHKNRFLLALLLVLALALVIYPFDPDLLLWIRRWHSHTHYLFARELSIWGNYLFLSLILPAAIGAMAHWRGKMKLRDVAVAAILAASFAGLATNVFRFSLGRPRPFAKKTDGFYGPSTNYKYHGFPSAHSATSMATAATFVAAAPVIGAPLALGALAVGWSRIYRRRHHPVDVMVGATIGAIFGVAFGVGVRRRYADSGSDSDSDGDLD